MVYGTYNYSYWGEPKPTNITGGPHIVAMLFLTLFPVFPVLVVLFALPLSQLEKSTTLDFKTSAFDRNISDEVVTSTGDILC